MLFFLIYNFTNLFFTNATQLYLEFFSSFILIRTLYNNDITFFKNVLLN